MKTIKKQPKTMYLTRPDGTRTRRVKILRVVDLCGVPGFAVHQGPDATEEFPDFRLSHVKTGALTSLGAPNLKTAEEAISDAERLAEYSAKVWKTTPKRAVQTALRKVVSNLKKLRA